MCVLTLSYNSYFMSITETLLISFLIEDTAVYKNCVTDLILFIFKRANIFLYSQIKFL